MNSGNIGKDPIRRLDFETDDTDTLIQWFTDDIFPMLTWKRCMTSQTIEIYCPTKTIEMELMIDDDYIKCAVQLLPSNITWVTVKLGYLTKKLAYCINPSMEYVAHYKVGILDELLHSDIKLKPIILQFPSIII